MNNLAEKIIKQIMGNQKKGKDTDGDRVPDKDDCQPRNTMRQDDYATDRLASIAKKL